MKKLKIIFNLITLALTTGLLVMITVAWYAVNKQASVEAGTGAVANLPGLVEQVDYYNFNLVSDIENSTNKRYTIETHITNNGTCDMQQYLEKFDPNYKPTAYLIRIKIKTNTAISSLRFISSATHFVGFGTRTYVDSNVNTVTRYDHNGILDTDNLHLSLSSAVKFTLLSVSTSETSVVNGNTATFTYPADSSWKEFEYGTDGSITTSTVEALTNPITANASYQYIHILLDYNVDYLNELYGNNLTNQNALMYNDGAPQFTNKDFIIYLLG